MKKLVNKYRFEIMMSMLLLIYLMCYTPVIDETIGWCITPYTLSYKYGFISRGIIGTIIRFFIPNLTIRHIYLIIIFNTIILCAMTIYFIGYIRKITGMKENLSYLFTGTLFIVNPGSIAFLFYWGNFGRFDLIMILILMISACLIIRERFLFIIPLISVFGILTHQAYLFMYFPALIVLLMYSGWVKKNRYSVIIFWITGITTCAAFLYMQFFSGVVGYDYESMMNEINATTDIPAKFIYDDMMVRLEYFTSVFATIKAFVIDPLARNLFKIACTIILCLPLLVFFGRMWKDFMSDKKSIFLWIIPWSGMIGMIPKFLMTNDYGRDFSALIITQFVMIFTILALGDAGMKKAFSNLEKRINANPLKYIFILIYMGSLGKFQAANIIEISHRIYLVMEKLFGLD